MHRSFIALIAATLLVLAVAVPVSAKPEATGPACADIVSGTGVGASYTTETAGRQVSFLFELYTASCANVRYAGYIYDASGTTLLASGLTAGDGAATHEVGLAVPVPSGHDTVCVYAATESGGGSIFDRAPDATGTCVQLTIDSGTGLSKFG